MNCLFFLITAFFVAPNTYAGDEVNNGGDAVVCYNGEAIQSVELLDLYEQSLRGPLISRNGSYQAIVDQVLLTIQKKSSFGIYFDAVREEMNSVGWWATTSVDEIDDSGNVPTLPRGCRLIQLASQFKYQVRYNQELFSRLTEDSKAALVLHEGIYQLARLYGHKNSAVARQIVGLLWSEALESQSGHVLNQSFGSIISDTLFAPSQVEGVSIPVKLGAVTPISQRIVTPRSLAGHWFASQSALFYPNGALRRGEPLNNLLKPYGDKNLYFRGPLEFSAAGKLLRGQLTKDVKLRVGHKDLPLTGRLSFDESGKLLSAQLARPTFVKVNGRFRLLIKGATVYFDVDGDVVNFKK